MDGNMRILVADDQEPVRKRVIATLTAHPGFEVVAEASTGLEAVLKSKKTKPDLLILDITMPEMNGLDAARNIHSFLPESPIIILSVHKGHQLMEEARKIGVKGYVIKGEAVQKLIQAIEAVSRNDAFFPS